MRKTICTSKLNISFGQCMLSADAPVCSAKKHFFQDAEERREHVRHFCDPGSDDCSFVYDGHVYAETPAEKKSMYEAVQMHTALRYIADKHNVFCCRYELSYPAEKAESGIPVIEELTKTVIPELYGAVTSGTGCRYCWIAVHLHEKCTETPHVHVICCM